jgi:sulfur-oxidizing protein SoxX
MKLIRNVLLIGLALVPLGCANAPSNDQIAAQATAMLLASFKASGQAGLDRLTQDETQRVCSELAGKAPAKDVAEKIEKLNLVSIRYPADGSLLGDWRNGEKIAQEGRGKQFSDDVA